MVIQKMQSYSFHNLIAHSHCRTMTAVYVAIEAEKARNTSLHPPTPHIMLICNTLYEVLLGDLQRA